MNPAPHAPLPDLSNLDAEQLRALIVTQHEQITQRDVKLAERDIEIEHLKLLIAKLKRIRFGHKSEKLDRQIEQLELRLEDLEAKQASITAPSEEPISTDTEVPARPARRRLPEQLPRESVTRMPKQTSCPSCGGTLRLLGEDVSEMLE